MSARDKLLALRVPIEAVTLPELGGETVYIHGLSSRERDTFEETMTIQRGKKFERNLANIRARFVVLVTRDADGKRLFTDADVAIVGELPSTVTDRIFDVGRKLSGMTAEDVEELGKGSASDPPERSRSTSSERSAE